MVPENLDSYLENQTLKSEFARRNLDLSPVWEPTPDDVELENRRLRSLLDWVEKYEECPDRKKMEAQGYDFPPIQPDIDPDSDWFRFRRWMLGKPIRKSAKSRLPQDLALKHPDDLTDEQIVAELDKLEEALAKLHISVDLNKGIPARLVYEHVLDCIEEEFELLGGHGWWHLDGCTGYCPDCFQRPWCEAGGGLCWSEDEEAGHIAFPDQLRRYVSPSPTSLSILRREQEKHDAWMKEFMETADGEEHDDVF